MTAMRWNVRSRTWFAWLALAGAGCGDPAASDGQGEDPSDDTQASAGGDNADDEVNPSDDAPPGSTSGGPGLGASPRFHPSALGAVLSDPEFFPNAGGSNSGPGLEAPQTQISFGPNSPSNQRTVEFSFNSSRTRDFECRVDMAKWERCSSPFMVRDVNSGQHVFEVRAFAAPELNAPVADWPWETDLEAPKVTLQSTPPMETESPSARFEFSSDEPQGGHFECRRDGGAWVRCGSPLNYESLVEGPHSLEVAAVDAAGNRGQAAYAWTIQRAPETFLINGLPPPLSTVRDVRFEFTSPSPDVAEFECSLDGAAFMRCGPADSADYKGLKDGLHTFEVRAVDDQGLRDETPANVTWTVDGTGPQVFLDQAPEPLVGSGDAQFVFRSNDFDLSRFECRLDFFVFAQCSSPMVYAQLPNGSHTFEVKAIDTAGNPGPIVAHQWQIDGSLPETFFQSSPAGVSGSSEASFTFASPDVDVVSFECSLDGALFLPCSSPHTELSLVDGPHEFAVRSVDNLGHVDPTPAKANWTVDLTPPETQIDSGPLPLTSSNSPAFTFSSTATDLSTFECSLDGATFVPCSGSQFYYGVVDGPHTVEVRGVDTAGNKDPSPASWSWAIDTQPPDTNLVSGPPNPTTENVSFVFDSPAADIDYFECALDSGGFAPCASPWEPTVTEGWHWAYIRARDLAGNIDFSSVNVGFSVDATAPDTILEKTPPEYTAFQQATFEFRSPEWGTSFVCSVDFGNYVPCVSPYQVNLTSGSHTFYVAAVDGAGNQDESPERFDFTVTPSCAKQVLFFDDGEAGLSEWDISGPWALTPGDVGSGFAFSDSPTGPYGDGVVASITSQAIAVPGASCWTEEHSRLSLSFTQALELADGDSVYVEVSDDGVSWLRVFSQSGPTPPAIWQKRRVDLGRSVTARPGETLYLRFVLESDAGTPGEGWAVDDIELVTLPVKPRLWATQGGCSAPIVADVDGDSLKEVVVSHGSTVRCLSGTDGTVDWSSLVSDSGDTTFPAVANVDSDPAQEVFVATHVTSGNQRQVRLLALDGAAGLESWRYDVGAAAMGVFAVLPTVADWNQDGQLDVAFPVSHPDERLHIFNAATGGLLLNKHLDPMNEGNFDLTQPVTLFDVDTDGTKDIFLSLYKQAIGPRLLRLDGLSASPVWEYLMLSASGTGPVLADLNDDSALEVVVAHFGTDAISAATGTQFWNHPGSGLLVHPAAADLNGDDSHDVLVSTYFGGTILYALSGTDKAELWRVAGDEVTGAPAIADVDEDGQLEVIVGMKKGLLVLDGATGEVEWTYGVANPLAPTIADADGDGQLEVLVCGDGTLHVVSLGSNIPDPSLLPWPRYRRDARNSGVLSGPLPPL